MASKADKKGRKKRERAEKLKNRAMSAAKDQASDAAERKMGTFQLYLVAGLFIAAGVFIIYAYS